jgi:hypothetical protein
VRRGPCHRGGTGRGVGVLRTCLDGDQHRSRCEIRAMVMHVYPDGIRAYPHERLTVYLVRRGKPVRKLRTMLMARAHELSKKLQGRFGTTVPVVRGPVPDKMIDSLMLNTYI